MCKNPIRASIIRSIVNKGYINKNPTTKISDICCKNNQATDNPETLALNQTVTIDIDLSKEAEINKIKVDELSTAN